MKGEETRGRWTGTLRVTGCVAAWLALSAQAAEPTTAAGQLATIERQLDTIDRLAAQAEQLPQSDRPRYHFDYARLHADVSRMRAGLQDYLIPPRAQPRDAAELIGDYRIDPGSGDRP
jgi:RAQPRD family integrative conjugative element protein